MSDVGETSEAFNMEEQLVKRLRKTYTRGQQNLEQALDFNQHDGSVQACATNLWDFALMQYNLSDSFFEQEEGIKIGDGVYFQLDPSSYGGNLDEVKTLQVFS